MSDYSKATWTQNFIASVAGAVASITVAAPLDTIKTRIQNANFEQKTRGVTIVRDLLRDEGASALFKGLTPKVTRQFLFSVLVADIVTNPSCRSWSSARNWCSATPLRSP